MAIALQIFDGFRNRGNILSYIEFAVKWDQYCFCTSNGLEMACKQRNYSDARIAKKLTNCLILVSELIFKSQWKLWKILEAVKSFKKKKLHIFRCDYASLIFSIRGRVRPSVRRSVRPSVPRYFRKTKIVDFEDRKSSNDKITMLQWVTTR